MTRSASAIASGSRVSSSKSASRATPATGLASGWNARRCQRCWLRTIGFYFRVIQEGEIGAGDCIVKLSDGPERMTVAEIDALLYSAEHPLEALRRAVRIPALSPGWQRSMQGLLAAAEAGGTTGNAGLGPARRHPLRGVAFARL
jgi:3-alpha domain